MSKANNFDNLPVGQSPRYNPNVQSVKQRPKLRIGKLALVLAVGAGSGYAAFNVFGDSEPLPRAQIDVQDKGVPKKDLRKKHALKAAGIACGKELKKITVEKNGSWLRAAEAGTGDPWTQIDGKVVPKVTAWINDINKTDALANVTPEGVAIKVPTDCTFKKTVN